MNTDFRFKHRSSTSLKSAPAAARSRRSTAHGKLHVGPRSAGSTPGPAAFGRGGDEPTVTDANLVLRRIGGQTFLNGALPLDEQLARNALTQRVAQPLGYEDSDAARVVANGIVGLADMQMAMAIKEITIERGKDVRDFALFAFGGGGPLHAISLARELKIGRVIVPPEPGNFSALGMLLADARVDETRSFLLDLDDAAIPILRAQIAELSEAVASVLARDFAGAAGQPSLPCGDALQGPASSDPSRHQGDRDAGRAARPVSQCLSNPLRPGR